MVVVVAGRCGLRKRHTSVRRCFSTVLRSIMVLHGITNEIGNFYVIFYDSIFV